MQRDPLNSQELAGKTLKFFKSLVAESFQVPTRQIPRVLFHGLILACIIAGFWLIDSLKDPVLATTIGIEYQPIAKLLSVLTTLVVVCVYDFLTSTVTKAALFHIISAVFGVLFMVLSAYLSDSDVGLASNSNKGPHRALGWLAYFAIEAYGSLMTALFWSFTNSIMDLEQAKGAYGLIIAIAQVGAIFGSTLATTAGTVGIPSLFIFGAMLVFSVSLLIKTYHIVYNDHTTVNIRTRVRSISESDSVESILTTMENAQHPGERIQPSLMESFGKLLSGFYEGLYLIGKHGYVLKLLGVACLYEIVVTILDYEFKVMASQSASAAALRSPAEELSEAVSSSLSAEDHFANLLGHFGQLTNAVSFVLSFFGFSYLVRHIGVEKSLLIFPLTLLVAVVVTYLIPKLWVLFMFVSLLKGMIFSLHDPVKELLYIPTSESIKFKAKAWIDVFGSRFAKAAGSLITSFAAGDAQKLHSIGEIPALAISIIIIYISWSMGKDFARLVETNTIIGEPEGKINYKIDIDGPIINGLKPGEVGYSGYDPHLFEGVFDDGFDFNKDFDPDQNKIGVEMTVLPHGMQALADAQRLQENGIPNKSRVRTRSAHL